MSEQPQDDHTLNIRLARLCGFPVTKFGTLLPEQYPQVRMWDATGRLELYASSDYAAMRPYDRPLVLWNPLKDERQAFRYVVKAMQRLHIGPAIYCGQREEGCQVQIVWANWTVNQESATSIARPICLAALDAAERLKNPMCTCGTEHPPGRPHRCPSLDGTEKLEERDGSR